MEENYKYSFDGMSMNELSYGIQDKFECLYENDCDRTVYLSKETYDQGEEEETYNFKYKYSIVEDVFQDPDTDEDRLFMSINIIPALESLTEKALNEVAEYSGIEPSEVTYEDLHFSGDFEVCLSHEEIPLGEDGYWEDPKVMQKLDIAANAVSTIDALRGFYLDRPQTGLGLTGWDYIYQKTRDEDYREQVNKRYEEMKEKFNA